MDRLEENKIFQTICICLLKGSNGSRYHIVSISNTWIFDSNLDFVLPLNKESMDWCCGVKQNGSTFDGFWEMACVGYCY